MALAIVFLSLVILIGYSGQLSLGHSAFMGIAAFTAAHLARDSGLPVWMALLLGALAAAPAGALLGVVAVRLHGLFLALMTLAFAVMAQELFFNEVRVSGGLFGMPLPRPEGATGETTLFYVVLGMFAACAALAVSLRGGRTGRALAAIRDSETASRALGLSVLKYKVFIFALSAFMAGLGAVFEGMIAERVGPSSFQPLSSLVLVTVGVVGGIFHVGGAITSGLLLGLYLRVFGGVDIMVRIQLILFGVGATVALAKNPEGFFGELRRGGSALLSAIRRARAPVQAAPLPVSGGEE
jgi:branched-chain amino acid transport system permease protein